MNIINPTNIDRSPALLRWRTAALLASLSFSLLAGCGGGGGGGGGGISPYASRSYSVAALAVGTGETGALTVALGSDGATIAGTLNILLSAAATSESRHVSTRQASAGSSFAVPLTGTFTGSTGAYSLNGSVTESGTTYAVTATGNLSTSSTTGGTTTVTVNGVTASGIFQPGAVLTGQLTANYFPLTPNALNVYQVTTTDVTAGSSPDISTIAGFDFIASGEYGNTYGATTTAQFGGKTVNKIAFVESDGTVDGYDFFTSSSTNVSFYGDESVDSSGNVTDTETVTPPFVTPFNLKAGQTNNQTVAVSDSSSGSSTFSGTVSQSLTFNDLESITVPTGTYTAAKFTQTFTFKIAGDSTDGAETSVSTGVFYLVPGIGSVQESDTEVDSVAATSSTPASSQTTTTEYLLTSTTGVSAETKSAAVPHRIGSSRMQKLMRHFKLR